jgi:cobalt-zinc-cadmium efflux system protein
MDSALTKINRHRFLLGIILNSLFIVVELIYGFKANSVALIADAVHNASDVLGLGLVWMSVLMSQKRATHKFTYGFKNFTIFSAFLNCVILLIAISNLVWESCLRIISPEPVVSTLVIFVAFFGVLVNGVTALLFIHGRKQDINIFSVFLNMALDTLLSCAIVVGGILIWWHGWLLVDPILGIVIAIFIIFSFWGLFKESLNLIMQAVPSNINLQEVIGDITHMPAVIAYHDLHVWPLSTTETALSVHIVVKEIEPNIDLTFKLAELFKQKYNIHHSTIQIEADGVAPICELNC